MATATRTRSEATRAKAKKLLPPKKAAKKPPTPRVKKTATPIQPPKSTIELGSLIAACCAKCFSRYALDAPRIIAKNGKGIACATNGRSAVVKPLVSHTGDPVDSIMPGGSIGSGSGKSNRTIRVDIEGLSATSCELNAKGERTRILADNKSLTEGTFPPIADVYPTSKPMACIVVNPQLLMDAMKAVQSNEPETPGVAIFIPIVEHASEPVGDDQVIHPFANTPLVVIGFGDLGGAGVVMPIHPKACSQAGSDNASVAKITFAHGKKLFDQCGSGK